MAFVIVYYMGVREKYFLRGRNGGKKGDEDGNFGYEYCETWKGVSTADTL